jgi:Clp amino terminal domain, pathogenicity island component
MFERFTDQARRAIVVAGDEARELGHDFIGTEHILIGLARAEEGVAHEVLESFGITAERVVEELERELGRGTQQKGGPIPFTHEAKKALELSLRESIQLGCDYIGTEHVLLGVAREGESQAAEMLRRAGADLQTLRGRVVLVAGMAAHASTGERLVTPRITPRATEGWPAGPPRLDRVVPIARELDVEDGWRLALLSLEIWAGLLDLRVAVFAVGDDPPALAGDYTDWTLSDDLGTEYAQLGKATVGPSRFQMGQVAFRPAPPPEAATLTLSLEPGEGLARIELVVELPQGPRDTARVETG